MKLIVGIDPGKNVGIALIDISSDFMKVFSKRDFSISNVCKYLIDNGEPIIIATDKKEVPKSVEKIAAAFNAKLFSPKQDISVNEKKEMTKGFTFNNTHEMDALAAAILAKRHFFTTFEKVDHVLKNKNLPHLSDTVKELLIKNEVGNIEQAIKMLTEEQKPKEVKIVPKIIETKKVMELNERIRLRERAIEILKNQVEELKKENKELRKTIIHDDSSRIENLRKSIASLKKEKDELISEMKKGDSSEKLKDRYEVIYHASEFDNPEDMKDKIVIVDKNNFSVARFGPKAIISDKFPEKAKLDVPIILKQQLNIRKIDNVLVADKNQIEEAIKECFFAWLKSYKERFNEEK